MKIIGFVLMFSVFIVSSVTYAGDKFMHPSTWGTDPSDDHYNTYLEDEDHICRKRWYGFEDECSEPINIYEDGAYAERSCWYGRHCSANHCYHAGIDYEVPNHIHDPDDYVNGQRKTIGIKQGRGGESLGYHGPDDDVKASNCGVVAYANNNTPHRFGKTVILRHVCNQNTPNLQNLCIQEGNEWVIYSQYSHMSKINVSTGDVVSRGQKIGEIGGTGNWIHHLHFEMKTKAVYHSPEKDQGNQISEDARGYTTTDPTNFGYRNPALFIGIVSAVCPGDGSNNSNGSGTSTGGAWHSGGPYPDDPIYDNDPFVPNADVSIRYLEIKGPGQSNHHTESGAVFSPGQTRSVDLKGKIKNESNDNTDMARIQYCATTKKKFRHDERIWIDEDYLDHQEREHDFDPGESITKHGQAFIQMK